MKTFKIENKTIGPGYPTFVAAEIGINHNGSFDRCKKMIKSAFDSGADAVKIQTIDETQSYSKNSKSYKVFKNKNFNDAQLLKLKRFSKKLGIIFFSTPGDIKSLKRLIKLKIPIIKISSGLANNYPLIREIIRRKIPLIISTGLSTIDEINFLNKFIRSFKFKKIAIMKCTSQYPANPENLDLNSIDYIQRKFKLATGYSDHALGDVPVIVAVARGASIIEKHFTLNRSLKGADHHISLEPKEFKEMVQKIRITERALGKKIFTLRPTIKKNRRSFLRYLSAIQDIKKGDIFNLNNLGFMRRKNKKIRGLTPKAFFKIENRKSKFSFKKGQLITKI